MHALTHGRTQDRHNAMTIAHWFLASGAKNYRFNQIKPFTLDNSKVAQKMTYVFEVKTLWEKMLVTSIFFFLNDVFNTLGTGLCSKMSKANTSLHQYT